MNNFNIEKAKFGYHLYTEAADCYSFDIDFVQRFTTTSRPLVFEVKHPNEKVYRTGNQAKNTLNMLREDAVYVMCTLNNPVDECLLVDGLITQKGRENIKTKIPYECIDTCKILQIYCNSPEEEYELNELCKGETVRFFVEMMRRKFRSEQQGKDEVSSYK